ncbi:metal-sensitive transcriptional repressor family protein [Mycobacteroides abscessus]|nr:metal-sensitive transcriptional repressor family protein [Mycobacteroides abscessus]
MSTKTSTGHGYSLKKDDYAKRLLRIEGQVRGIAKMIDEDKYCIDVLTQISAAQSALRSVALGLLDEHLGHCVTNAVASGVRTPTRSWRRPRRRSPAWCAARSAVRQPPSAATPFGSVRAPTGPRCRGSSSSGRRPRVP